jgi:hypothetical protein
MMSSALGALVIAGIVGTSQVFVIAGVIKFAKLRGGCRQRLFRIAEEKLAKTRVGIADDGIAYQGIMPFIFAVVGLVCHHKNNSFCKHLYSSPHHANEVKVAVQFVIHLSIQQTLIRRPFCNSFFSLRLSKMVKFKRIREVGNHANSSLIHICGILEVVSQLILGLFILEHDL